jgi:hypothetical protein
MPLSRNVHIAFIYGPSPTSNYGTHLALVNSMDTKIEVKRHSSKFPAAPRQDKMPRVVTEPGREPGTQKEFYANLPCTD